MNAPPFPLNPSIGEWFQNWVWNGARWVCSRSTGIRIVTTVFTASGPYQPSPGLVSLKVRCIGGGGGGGSAGPVPNVAWMLAGGAGGSGGYSEITLAAALVTGGVNVTVGAGGTSGGAGASSGQIVNGTGGNGGVTSFGAFCLANGGFGGEGNNANTAPIPQNGTGGDGADAGTGDFATFGAPGQSGSLTVDPAAAGEGQGTFETLGGSSRLGSNPNTGAPYWAGQWANGSPAPANSGAGGNGSVISQVGGGPLEGGSGGSGMCIVDEYCWADAAGDGEDCVNPNTVNVNARVALQREPWAGPGPHPGPRPPWKPGSPSAGFSEAPEAYDFEE